MRYCSYVPRCVACGEAQLSGECSASQPQLKCSSCGGNHTANYWDGVKWKEAKAALVKWAPVERSKGGSAPSPPAAQMAKRAEPSSNRKLLGLVGTTLSVGAALLGLLLQPFPTPLQAQSLKLLRGNK